MGSGLALEFMLRYPEMFEDYKVKCHNRTIRPGTVDYYKHQDGQVIVNFPTKNHFRYPSRLVWIEEGLRDFARTYKHYEISSVAFPKLGTNHGGLDWRDVKPLMEKCLSRLDIAVYICLDNLKDAEGIEKAMLDRFNSLSTSQLASLIRLSSKQIEDLQNRVPFNRFWHIGAIDSIGPKTYRALYRHFYEGVSKELDMPIQTSLFPEVEL